MTSQTHQQTAQTLSQLAVGPVSGTFRFYKYNRDFDGDQHYFSPREKLKNGGFRGITVRTTLLGRLPKKPKIDVVDVRTAANFDFIPWNELDSDIQNRFNEAG